MGFQELKFLFLFLPLFLLLYYYAPRKNRQMLLVAGSLAFYIAGTWQHPWFLAILLFDIVLTWVFGVLVIGSKPFLIGMLVYLFGSLLFFKYAGMFGVSTLLPLGISFFTFQMSAYLVDIYCKRIKPKDLWSYASGILLFPKLLSGPLMEPKNLFAQTRRLNVSMDDLDNGLRDFIIGLSLKVLLADRIGSLWTQVGNIGIDSISLPLAWYGLIAYSLQLYFDFCGYSRMAIGIGRMLGFCLPENFDHPYASSSIREFWRRWHITLGAWFKTYVYFPLGGSRNGTKKFILSTMAVWLFTGMWHGNSLNFVFWGITLGLLILLERFWLGERLEKHKILAHFYLIFTIMFTWLIFALPTLGDVGTYLLRLVNFGTLKNTTDFVRYGQNYTVILLIGMVFATPYPKKLWDKIRGNALGTLVVFVLFWAAVYCISISANDPFMYFSF